MLAVEATLPLVEYSLKVAASAAGDWQVIHLALTERLSEPYTCKLKLAEIGEGGDPDQLLGSSCVVEIRRSGVDERRLCGIVDRVVYLGVNAGRVVASVRLVPGMQALSQRSDTRIFQETTVPDVLEEVLEAALGPLNRTVKLDLRGSYTAREYCVQYRETDFDFVTRLMRECGIGYRFDHSGEAEELILFDANDSCEQFESANGRPIPVAVDGNELVGVECLDKLTWEKEIRPNRVVVRDFDWTQPALDLTREVTDDSGAEGEREIYDANPVATLSAYDDGKKAYAAEEVKTQANLIQQAETAQARTAVGAGNVAGLVPGILAEVTGHTRPELDNTYLVVAVTHHGTSSDGVIRGEPGTETRPQYQNDVELLPADVAYRPARDTEHPQVPGTQTATVVGPSSEEVYTDVHGRIKIQFHWDRQGKSDENSSCWVRVAQAWAGPGYGTLFLPRIGMEVVVTFLDGDPDRPLVVGAVYNGRNVPPWDLPNEKTKSGIHTRSSPNGTGRNELAFEDAKDQEEIFIHAQKDMNMVVKNDKSTSVDNDEAISIKKNRSLHVGGDESEVVDNDKTVQISGSHNEQIGKNMDVSVSGNRTESVSKGHSESVGDSMDLTVGKNLSVSVDRDTALTVGKSKSVKVAKEMEVSVGKVLKLTVSKDLQESIKEKHQEIVGKDYSLKAKKVHIVADDQVHIKSGKAELILKKNGDVTLNGKNINIKGSGNVVLKGKKIAQN